MCIAFSPLKTHTVLIVNPNAILTRTIFVQLMKFIARRYFQIVKFCSGIDHHKFASGNGFYVFPTLYWFTLKQLLRIRILKRLDHK